MATPVKKINPFAKALNGSEASSTLNLNKNRDTIIEAVLMSARTNVPVLFVSNPGGGKTTTIYNIGRKYDRHVEVLCGSQYSQDEILGFQTNEPGCKNLIVKEPEWYARIMENHNNKRESILFCDELSGASPGTQQALLGVILERTIRGGKKLPDDCWVVAAANYKPNLPGFSDIISPQLNRFCIINLLPDSNKEVVYEFTQPEAFMDRRSTTACTTDDWPELNNAKADDKLITKVVTESRAAFDAMFKAYQAGSNKGFLDIRNIMYDGIYDRDDNIPEVLNFISGRTISNTCKCILGMAELGLDSNSLIYNKVLDGLIGLGTNTWSPEEQDPDVQTERIEKYLKDIHTRFAIILNRAQKALSKSDKKVEENTTLSQLNKLMGKNTVSNVITAFIADEDNNKYAEESWCKTFKKISETYSLERMPDQISTIFKDSSNMLLFKSDMDCLDTLLEDINGANIILESLRPYIIELAKIRKGYQFYYEAAASELL